MKKNRDNSNFHFWLNRKLAKQQDNLNISKFMTRFWNMHTAELTVEIVNELVDKIIIHKLARNAIRLFRLHLL